MKREEGIDEDGYAKYASWGRLPTSFRVLAFFMRHNNYHSRHIMQLILLLLLLMLLLLQFLRQIVYNKFALIFFFILFFFLAFAEANFPLKRQVKLLRRTQANAICLNLNPTFFLLFIIYCASLYVLRTSAAFVVLELKHNLIYLLFTL